MLTHEIRVALRSLLASPRDRGFTAIAVVTLALGLGANTAIFSAVDGVLLRPAPVDDLARLAMVWETDRDTGTVREPASVPDYLDFVARSRTFASLAALAAGDVTLTQARGEPQRLPALSVTRSFLPMLGIAPLAGRNFTAEEAAVNGPPAVLISEALWERLFGRDPAALGSRVRIDDRPRTIVGIVPDVSDFGVLQVLSAGAYARGFADRGDRSRVHVWEPLEPAAPGLPRSTHPIFVIGRLAAGRSVQAAQQEMAGIAADLERAYPENAARGVHVEPLADIVFGPVRPAFLVLLGAVALVLLITCVNVANVMLARGSGRAREVAVRVAIGAGAGRLARQFLLESAILTGAATLLGVTIAVAALRAIVAAAPADIPRLETVQIDVRVLAVAAVVAAAVTIAFALIPVLQARRLDVVDALKAAGGPGASTGREGRRVRRSLVVAEFALASLLVAGAGLLVKSFWNLQQVDPGFRTEGVLKAEYQLPSTRYPADFRQWPNFKEMHAFAEAVLDRAEALPGVESAAIAGAHPLDPGFTNSFVVVGREAEARQWPEISVRRVTPGYFRTVDLKLVRGRLLRDADSTGAAPVVLINQAAASRFFAGREALGARIGFWGAARTIVGIVADEKFQGVAEASPIAVYAPLAQAPSATGSGVLLVRARGDVSSLGPAVRRIVAEVDPQIAVFGVEPLQNTLARSISRQRFTMLLLGLFAGLALLLAAIGIHGVLSYGIAQRGREIAIRVALGERPWRITRFVVGEALGLGLAGGMVGLAGAYALTRLLKALLFGLSPTDPLTFAGVPMVLLLVAAAASYAPARRATCVDPAAVLKGE
jgi:putative ABC transport system permease protein